MKNLPSFTIRESPRAKRVILKISDQHGLEVVIPRGFNPKQVGQIIREKREWIEQTFRKLREAGAGPDHHRQLPETIFFAAVNRNFQVEYVPSALPYLELVHLNQANLIISGDTSDLQACRDLFRRWLQHQGHLNLIPWLEQVSAEIGLPYQRVQIRGQKSRWGSCSNRGTICLNHHLLFLRPALVRYLIIHELCHTVHLNHAAGFYQLCGQFVPDYRELRAEIHQARHLVPWWAL
jgi:predicted metal-dependent hydrolase